MLSCVDMLIRLEARRNDPTINLEELEREKLAIQNETERLMQDNVQRRSVSIGGYILLSVCYGGLESN